MMWFFTHELVNMNEAFFDDYNIGHINFKVLADLQTANHTNVLSRQFASVYRPILYDTQSKP
jgi:hypothetical protein